MNAKARLGRIAYLNVLPIYFALEHIFAENGYSLVRGTPAELNALMCRGEAGLFAAAGPVHQFEGGGGQRASVQPGAVFPAGRADH
jgi:predicted solute-binding protein